VTATESDSALAAKAQACLASNGCGNVTVRPAAPADGDAAQAPYDVIVLNGATEIVRSGSTGNCAVAADWWAFLRRHGRRGPPS
jgi:Protein-L-isoaspartate carboxylmethyltransferase